jgi:hypothetical protein
MDIDDRKIREAVERTEILRAPQQTLHTFGITNINYYLVTEPTYSDLIQNITETVVREGRVIAERPRIVTPYYLSNLEGFSTDARKYFDALIKIHGPNIPGLFYTYRNEPRELNIVSDNLLSVVEKLNIRIDERGDPLAAIIKGQDELWDVSLIKFIFEITSSSLENNIRQMGARGLLDIDDGGIPSEARLRIEELFRRVTRGEIDPRELKVELDRWGLFDQYEDRFFNIFKRR